MIGAIAGQRPVNVPSGTTAAEGPDVESSNEVMGVVGSLSNLDRTHAERRANPGVAGRRDAHFDEAAEEDTVRLFRGLLVALPCAILLWGLIWLLARLLVRLLP